MSGEVDACDSQVASSDTALNRETQLKDLPLSTARHLEETSWAIVPSLFQELAGTQILRQELDHPSVAQECRGKSHLPEAFGTGAACVCDELQIPNLPAQTCPCCIMGRSMVPDGDVSGEVAFTASGHPMATPSGGSGVPLR